MARSKGDDLGNKFARYLVEASGFGAIVRQIAKEVRDPVEDTGKHNIRNSEEERFAEFLSDAALPRNAHSYTAPMSQDKSDIVRDRDEPILLNPQIDHLTNIILGTRERKDGITEYVENLDRFWAAQYAATIQAFTLLTDYHRHNNRPNYIPGYEEYLAGRFLMYRRLVDAIKIVMPDLKGRKAIEVGGGSGISLAMLAQNGAEVTNLDISEIALKYFECLAGHYNVKNKINTERADFFKGDPELSNRFDLTYNVGVFEHLTRDEQSHLLEEMVRITAPSG